jgi:hypothetical protein
MSLTTPDAGRLFIWEVLSDFLGPKQPKNYLLSPIFNVHFESTPLILFLLPIRSSIKLIVHVILYYIIVIDIRYYAYIHNVILLCHSISIIHT